MGDARADQDLMFIRKVSMRKYLIRNAAAVLLILLSVNVFGEDSKQAADSKETASGTVVITREKAVDLALSHSRTLKESRIDYEQASRISSNSWNELFPGFSVSGSAGSSAETESFSSGENLWNGSYSLGMSFSLNPDFRENMKQKSITEAVEKISLDQSISGIQNTAEKLFYYLLASEKNIEIKEKAYSLAEKQYRQTEINFKNGLASELQLLQSRISAENRKPEIASAKLDYESNLITFKNLLGIENREKIELSGDLKIDPIDFDPDMLVESYIKTLPDIEKGEKNISYYESVLRGIIKSNKIPVFSVSGAYSNTLYDMTDNMPANVNSGEWIDNASVTLSLSWSPDSLFGFTSEREMEKSAADSLEKMRLQYADLLDETEKEIISSVLETETYKDNLSVSVLNKELAERSYQMTEESFRKGTAESLEVDEARQEWETAEQNYLTSLYNYRSAVLDLAYLLNTDVETLRRIGRNE